MPIEFQMPKLGLTMEQGTILQWLVEDGDHVAAGTPVLVIETDKVETEVEIPAGGRLVRTGQVGDSFACGVSIGWILAPGEEPPASSVGAPGPSTPTVAPNASSPQQASPTVPVNAARSATGRLLVSPNARRVAKDLGVSLETVQGTGPGGRIVSEDVEAAAATAATRPAPAVAAAGAVAGWGAAPVRSSAGIEATPAAWQLAQLLGIDLHRANVPTLSSDGKVGREDVAEYARALIARGAGAPIAVAAPSAQAAAPAESSTKKLTFPLSQTPSSTIAFKGMRGTIASRMHASLQEMAQLTLTMDVDMDAVVADRDRRKAAGDAVVPGYTDYVIKAAAIALQQHPGANAQVTDDGIALLPQVNVGMAVAVDGGLVVPVVQNTPARSLADLSAETTRLAQAARSGSLKLPDLEGGTFSVTALGMFGVDAFTPVINPPNAAILGVGRLRDDTAWVDGSPTRVQRLTLSLTWDHRVLDGAPAAEFCRSIKTLLEDPSLLG